MPFSPPDQDDFELEAEEAAPPRLDDTCVACRGGFHDECVGFWAALDQSLSLGSGLIDFEKCCCGGTFDLASFFQQERAGGVSLEAGRYVPAAGSADDGAAAEIEWPAYWGAWVGAKPLDAYKDPISTGRKDAARKAPIKPGSICEWAWLAQAGGGVLPIIGCPGRPASDRHHGPDKNTMRNEVGTNLHRICDWCHNQWHAKNDPFYGPRALREDGSVDPTVPFLPVSGAPVQAHDPVTRALDEVVYKEDALRREEARRHGADI